ncbi:hypothetical protein [Rubrolithibacter danxiaensis]|uniref:hypothetical protein n=1 Tax=Rubrolithibacter danxiaensis TaxID=3390805 RepID=UPI003BF92690
MKKVYYYAAVLGVTAMGMIVSCKKETKLNPGKVILNTETDNRLKTYPDGEIVPVVNYGDQRLMSLKNPGRIASTDISSGYNLKLVAEVEAPKYEGKTLQATEVAIAGNRAYVSYNTQGETYLGAVDVLDITNATPKLLQSAVTPGIDISSVTSDNTNLYIAGAVNIDQNPDFTSPAVVSRISISNGLLTDQITNVKLGGYVANSVSISDNDVFVTSGNTNGGVSVIDKNSLTVKKTIALDGAKDIAVNSSEFTVLSGAYAGAAKQTLGVYDRTTYQLKRSSDVPAGINSDAKSNIAATANAILLSNGTAGITMWSSTSGTKLDAINLPSVIENIAQEDIYTNSVSVADNYVYGANGAAGLVVSRVNSQKTGLEIMGIADVTGSANYVKAANGLIFVASGKGGLQIYKLESKAVAPPVATTPSCESRLVLASNPLGWYNNNSGSKEYYRGSAMLGGLNVNDVFDYCGSLLVLSTTNINSNGQLNVNGSLAVNGTLNVNKTLKVGGDLTAGTLTLNSNGNVEMLTSADLVVKGNMTLNSGSVLKVRGNLEIDRDFTFNGGTIEFIGDDCSVQIKGKVYGAGGNITGTYKGKIK